MRLQQPIYVDKRVLSIKLRIVATDVPTSAAVLVTDVQLQAGEQATGIVPNPAEVGTTIDRTQYRNGVVNNRMTLVLLSNGDQPAPAKLTVQNAKGETRIGSYRYGHLNGSATADGVNNTATHGWGKIPVITPRSDLNLEAYANGRLHLRASWNERK